MYHMRAHIINVTIFFTYQYDSLHDNVLKDFDLWVLHSFKDFLGSVVSPSTAPPASRLLLL